MEAGSHGARKGICWIVTLDSSNYCFQLEGAMEILEASMEKLLEIDPSAKSLFVVLGACAESHDAVSAGAIICKPQLLVTALQLKLIR